MKSATIKILSAFIVSIMAIGSSNARAANEVLSDWTRIDYIEPTVKGWVWIYLKDGATVTCGTTPDQTATNPFLVFTTTGNNHPTPLNGGFDRVYSAILSALMADREIRFRLSPSTDGKWCYVERIYLR